MDYVVVSRESMTDQERAVDDYIAAYCKRVIDAEKERP